MLSSPAPAAIVGPTASGKSALALALARRRPGTEIVSVDSMGVYRGMDIGTAKASLQDRAEVPHHLLDLADPSEEFSVSRFQEAARPVLSDARERGAAPLLVGGTGLYLRSLSDPLTVPGRWPELAAELGARATSPGGSSALHAWLARLDPVAAARMEPTNARRVVRALEVTLGSGRPFSSHGPGLAVYPPTPVRMVGLRVPAPVLVERIAARIQAQVEAGWLEEVRALDARPEGLSATAAAAVGYRELLGHLAGQASLGAALEATRRRSARLARRQRAWFERDPRIVWVDAARDGAELVQAVEAALGGSQPCPV